MELESNVLDDSGMVKDFGDLGKIKEAIDAFDHTMVFWGEESEDIVGFFIKHFNRVLVMRKNPTAENMAHYMFQQVSLILHSEPRVKVKRVIVRETTTGRAVAYDSTDHDQLIVCHLEAGDPNENN